MDHPPPLSSLVPAILVGFLLLAALSWFAGCSGSRPYGTPGVLLSQGGERGCVLSRMIVARCAAVSSDGRRCCLPKNHEARENHLVLANRPMSRMGALRVLTSWGLGPALSERLALAAVEASALPEQFVVAVVATVAALLESPPPAGQDCRGLDDVALITPDDVVWS